MWVEDWNPSSSYLHIGEVVLNHIHSVKSTRATDAERVKAVRILANGLLSTAPVDVETH